MIWRLVTSEHLRSSLIEVQRDWTVEDVYDAHEALDIIDAMETQARDKAKREGENRAKKG